MLNKIFEDALAVVKNRKTLSDMRKKYIRKWYLFENIYQGMLREKEYIKNIRQYSQDIIKTQQYASQLVSEMELMSDKAYTVEKYNILGYEIPIGIPKYSEADIKTMVSGNKVQFHLYTLGAEGHTYIDNKFFWNPLKMYRNPTYHDEEYNAEGEVISQAIDDREVFYLKIGADKIVEFQNGMLRAEGTVNDLGSNLYLSVSNKENFQAMKKYIASLGEAQIKRKMTKEAASAYILSQLL